MLFLAKFLSEDGQFQKQKKNNKICLQRAKTRLKSNYNNYTSLYNL